MALIILQIQNYYQAEKDIGQYILAFLILTKCSKILEFKLESDEPK